MCHASTNMGNADIWLWFLQPLFCIRDYPMAVPCGLCITYLVVYVVSLMIFVCLFVFSKFSICLELAKNSHYCGYQ